MKKTIISWVMILAILCSFSGNVWAEGEESEEKGFIRLFLVKQEFKLPSRGSTAMGIVMREDEDLPHLVDVKEIREFSDRVGYMQETVEAVKILTGKSVPSRNKVREIAEFRLNKRNTEKRAPFSAEEEDDVMNFLALAAEFSVACGPFNPATQRATIRNTCNNDQALWVVVLQDGRIRFINRDEQWFNIHYASSITLSSSTIKRLDTGYVQYGRYKPEILNFTLVGEDRVMQVRFNNNRLTEVVINGQLVYDLNPADVEKVLWNSDIVGWGEQSNRFAPLVKKSGNWTASIGSMPDEDWGFISLKIVSGPYAGQYAWLNNNAWVLRGAHAYVDCEEGCQIEYRF